MRRPLSMITGSSPISTKTALTLSAASAVLGPLLDNYHSQFHILTYKAPLQLRVALPFQLAFNFTTAPFTPPLFIIAGLLISAGTLRINRIYTKSHLPSAEPISMPRALATVAAFSAIYYLSAVLPCTGASVVTGPLLAVLAGLEWYVLDGSVGGLVMGMLTGIGGPVVEMMLINLTGSYSYASPELAGIPLFITAVYFAGGPAVGNLARAVEGSYKRGDDSGTDASGIS